VATAPAATTETAEPSPVSGRGSASGGHAEPEPSPVSGPGSNPEEDIGSIDTSLFYKMSADERALILAAKDSKEVPIKTRNKLYAALNRFLESSKVTKSVADAWKAASEKGHHGKFEFLQQWAKDTSGGNVELTETHSKVTEDRDDVQYTWVTRCDLYIDKKAYTHPQIMVYCDKLIAAAKSKKHIDPKFKNDPDMKMYRILNKHLENHTELARRNSDMTIAAKVEKGAQSSVIAQFAVKPKVDICEAEGEKKEGKKPRVEMEQQRANKIKADLDVGAEIVKEGSASDNIFMKQVVETINKQMTELKSLSHKMHEHQLVRDEATVNELWAEASALCKSMKGCIDSARSLMCPGSFSPYTTQWDTALV
jgi:hypothetical protein